MKTKIYPTILLVVFALTVAHGQTKTPIKQDTTKANSKTATTAPTQVSINMPTTLQQSDSNALIGFTDKKEAKNKYVNKLKQGKWIEYVDTTYVFTSGKESIKTRVKYYCLRIYEAGKIQGIENAYAEDGKWHTEKPYVDGKMQGVAKHYDKDGKLQSETPYVNGKLQGLQKMYYEDGKLQGETPYVDGKLHGMYKMYYEYGKMEIPYVNGQAQGMAKQYYEDGKLHIETPYADGKTQGMAKQYYEDGKLSSETPYVDGKMQGLQKHYNQNGTLYMEFPYVDDKMQGIGKGYYPDGKLESETPYVDGKMQGTLKHYYKDGTVKMEFVYKNNKMVSSKYFPPSLQEEKRIQQEADVYKEKEKQRADSIEKVKEGEFKTMAEQYRALKTKPEMPEEQRKYIVQASAFTKDKNYEKAVDAYNRAIDIDPTYPPAHFNQALLLALVNKYKEAVTEMKKYLLLVPDAPDARAAQDKIYEWEAKTGK